MLFNTLTAMAFATIAVAAPQLGSKYERELVARNPGLAVERGLIWVPRGIVPRKNKNNNDNNNNNNNNVVEITQLQETQLTVAQQGQEIQITQLVEEQLVIVDQTRQNKDNIRKNHYRNRNSNVNIIIIVVTQVVDIRDSSNVNTRYMTHQIQSNEQISEQQIVVVSDAVAMTVGGNIATAVQGNASPTGTGVSSPNIMTFDPNAAPSVSNCTMLLPAGISAPNFDNTQVNQDPAIIILENQAVFVQFVSQSQSNSQSQSS